MKTKHLIMLVSTVIGLAASACGLSQAEIAATAVQSTAYSAATLTAQAPTATPTITPSPTATPTQTLTPTPSSTPTVTPTPTPRWISAALTLADVPAGYRRMSDEEMGPAPVENALPFGFTDDANLQAVLGYLIPLPSRAAQIEFDNIMPNFANVIAGLYGAENPPRALPGLEKIGEARVASTFKVDAALYELRWDVVVFRRGEVGVYMFVFYPDGDQPAVKISDLARTVDERLSQAFTSSNSGGSDTAVIAAISLN